MPRKPDKFERAVDRLWSKPQSLAELRSRFIRMARRIDRAAYKRGRTEGRGR